MITDIIDAFKTVHNLKKSEIARAIGISESSIDKHRQDPYMAMTEITSKRILDYIVDQLTNHFNLLSDLDRQHILDVISKNTHHFAHEHHRLTIRVEYVRAMKKYRYGAWGQRDQ